MTVSRVPPGGGGGVVATRGGGLTGLKGLKQLGVPYVCVNEMSEGSVGHVIPDEQQGVWDFSIGGQF